MLLRPGLEAFISLLGRDSRISGRPIVVKATTEDPIREGNQQKEPKHWSGPVECRSVDIGLCRKGQEDDDEDAKSQRKQIDKQTPSA